ncbi:SAV_2336 N-terminal domain-related protein [Streptomyces sp. NPDC001351]|uniref:SAV_2336 N-terminal domain-related protein n=1 Tax=Streptomyces sp. NPDC001351 TaxID=3364564 RepID=UPI0036CDB931
MATPDGQLGELAERLRSLGAEPSPRELAEALWLARYIGPAAVRPETPRQPRPTADHPDDAQRPAPQHRDTPQAPPAPGESGARTRLHAERPGPAGHPQPEQPDGQADFVPVRVPMATALPHPLALQRALRPLQHYRPPVRSATLHLDEQATAEQAAETRLLLPVLRPAVRREARLRLLMDVSTSTGVWETALDELRQICQGLGAFREVTVHHLREDADANLVAATSRDGDRAVRAAEQLRDPTGRQLTLVLSDCAGPLWRSGRMQRLLHHWGVAAPVAVVQPLPQRMWRRTHLPALPGVLRRHEGLGARLGFTPLDGETPPGALPVPVLAPTRTALGTWARLLAGSTGLALPAPAAWVRSDHPAAAPRPVRAEVEAEPLVAGFRRIASRQAVQLAVSYSAIPLALPVMQLVQRAMQPQSDPTVLAEVLLSGLLERGAEDGWYEFRPGVREALLRLLPRGDALLVLKHCGEYVDRHFGRQARNFPALALTRLRGRDADFAEGDAEGVPDAFAEVSALVTERFEGAAAPVPVRREPIDVVHVAADEAWAAWTAVVLGAHGQEVTLRQPEPVTSAMLANFLRERLTRHPGLCVVLLIGEWYTEVQQDGPLREVLDRHAERLLPFTVMRTAADSWVGELDSVTRLWDTTPADAERRLLSRLGIAESAVGPVGSRMFPGTRLLLWRGVPQPGLFDSVREDKLRHLREILTSDRLPAACVVTGPKHTGKSALLSEYARRHRAEYDIVWWVGELGARRRRERLAGLGVELGLSAEGSLDDRLAELKRVLRETGLRWLIVFSGWDDEETVAHLPVGGHVLITSTREDWSGPVDVVRMEEPADDSGADLLAARRVLSDVVRIHAGDTELGSGFFLAPGVIVTSARLLDHASDADGGGLRAVGPGGIPYTLTLLRAVGELALLQVISTVAVSCLWLTDAPDTRPDEVVVYTAGSDTRATASHGLAVGTPGARTMEIVGAEFAFESIGAPVLSQRDGAVVGVVTRAGEAVRIETLRDLCLQSDEDRRLWHRIMRAHDRDHASPWTHDDLLVPYQKAQLYGVLAQLDPPRTSQAVLRLLAHCDVPAPDHVPRSWRDGAGHLYAVGSEELVVLYGALLWEHLSVLGASEGTMELHRWLSGRAPGGLTAEQQRVVTRVLEAGHAAAGCHITVRVTEGPERYAWSLRAAQGVSPLHTADGYASAPEENTPVVLEDNLRIALSRADTSRRRPTVEYRLPEELLWSVSVEGWSPGLALRADCNVYVRGLSSHTGYERRQGAMRWAAVSRGPLHGLWPPSYRNKALWRRPPDIRAHLSDAIPNAVPLLCHHTPEVPHALDAARELGYPLILWNRAERHEYCVDAYRAVDAELAKSGSIREVLARLRGLWIRQVFSEGAGASVNRLTVYYDPPEDDPAQ